MGRRTVFILAAIGLWIVLLSSRTPNQPPPPVITPPVVSTDNAWYLAHLDRETCVPLSNIGPNFERVYYASGDMRTPDDLANTFRRMGTTVTPMPSKPNAVFFTVAGSGQSTIVAVIKGKSLCQKAMKDIAP